MKSDLWFKKYYSNAVFNILLTIKFLSKIFNMYLKF